MFSNDTPFILQESLYSYKFLNPITFNGEQLREMLDYGVATFLTWAGLIRCEKVHKYSVYDF